MFTWESSQNGFVASCSLFPVLHGLCCDLSEGKAKEGAPFSHSLPPTSPKVRVTGGGQGRHHLHPHKLLISFLTLSFQLGSRIKKTLIASEFHALLPALVTRSARFCGALPPRAKVPSADVTLGDSTVNKEGSPQGSGGALRALLLRTAPSWGL